MNSFGFGGSNAHVVLEEPSLSSPSSPVESTEDEYLSFFYILFVCSLIK